MATKSTLSLHTLEAREVPTALGMVSSLPAGVSGQGFTGGVRVASADVGGDNGATSDGYPDDLVGWDFGRSAADQPTRHLLFALVDRTPMPAGANQSVAGRITSIAADPTDSAPDGRKFKMLVAPLILDGSAGAPGAALGKYLTLRPRPADAPAGESVPPGADVGGADRGGPFYNFMSASLVRETGDSFYGTGVYKSTDSGRTWGL